MSVYRWQWLSEGSQFNFMNRIVHVVGLQINFQNGSEIAHAICTIGEINSFACAAVILFLESDKPAYLHFLEQT